MKTFSSITFLLSASSFASVALGMCGPFGNPDWYCDVCGSSGGGTGSSPVVCEPFNATFDELTSGKSVGIYKSAKWSHFAAVDGRKPSSSASYSTPHLAPFSKPNLAHLKSGRSGIVSFGYENGTAPGPASQYPVANFYSFHYGCALPSTTPASVRTPVACSVQVKAECVQPGGFVPPVPTTPFSYTVQYKPTSPKNYSLAYHQGDPARDAGYYCFNYTLTSTKGTDLYLDDVLYGTLRQRVI